MARAFQDRQVEVMQPCRTRAGGQGDGVTCRPIPWVTASHCGAGQRRHRSGKSGTAAASWSACSQRPPPGRPLSPTRPLGGGKPLSQGASGGGQWMRGWARRRVAANFSDVWGRVVSSRARKACVVEARSTVKPHHIAPQSAAASQGGKIRGLASFGPLAIDPAWFHRDTLAQRRGRQRLCTGGRLRFQAGAAERNCFAVGASYRGGDNDARAERQRRCGSSTDGVGTGSQLERGAALRVPRPHEARQGPTMPMPIKPTIQPSRAPQDGHTATDPGPDVPVV